jgi:hypothetical protein
VEISQCRERCLGDTKILKHIIKRKELCLTVHPRNWALEGEGDEMSTPSDDMRGAVEAKEEIPLNIKCTSADQVTSSKGTGSDKKERAEEEGMETDLP